MGSLLGFAVNVKIRFTSTELQSKDTLKFRMMMLNAATASIRANLSGNMIYTS